MASRGLFHGVTICIALAALAAILPASASAQRPATFAELRRVIEAQPRTFDNTVLFRRDGDEVLRSERYPATSRR